MRRAASRARRASGRDGFLLVEALAALALGALILAALMSFTALMRRSADSAAARVQRLEVADRTVSAIAGEIRQAARLRYAADPAARRAAGAAGGNAEPGSEAAGEVQRRTTSDPRTSASRAPPGTSDEGGGEREPPRPFVFSGAPDRVAFALTPEQASGLRAAVLVAYQIDPTGAVLRAEGALPTTATDPGGVRLGPVARIDPGPERLRFAFVERQPGGAETIVDAWTEIGRMPAAVRIERTDPASGASLSSVRVPLLVDGEPGCVDPQKGFCSRAEKPQGGEAPAPGRPALRRGDPE